MDEDEFGYKHLRHIQQMENTSPALTKIHQQFYRKVSEYIQRLEHVAMNEQHIQKKKLATEEIQNIKRIITSISEHREKKIVYAALSASRGGKPELKHLIQEELIFFHSLVDLISQSRKKLFFKTISESAEEPKKADTTAQAVEKEPEKKGHNTNPIVRVTADIPVFVGTDMNTYLLQKEDVLSLAREMADPLFKRGVIQHIK